LIVKSTTEIEMEAEHCWIA